MKSAYRSGQVFFIVFALNEDFDGLLREDYARFGL
jgi:hypothetical protein